MQSPIRGITILLSTFNGENYLDLTLSSFESLVYPEFTILVRDDGSSDKTVEILHKHSRKSKCYEIMNDTEHLGLQDSYHLLILKSKGSIAFADQDDIWKEDKLFQMERRINEFEYNDGLPVLATCSFQIIDKNGMFLSNKILGGRSSARNPATDSPPPGFSMVLNDRLSQIVRQTYPGAPFYHDSWTYLCASLFGHVVHINDPLVNYRLHTHNEIGMRLGYKKFLKFISDMHNGYPDRGYLFLQLKELIRICESFEDLKIPTWVEQYVMIMETGTLIQRFNFIAKLEMSQPLFHRKIWKMLALWKFWT